MTNLMKITFELPDNTIGATLSLLLNHDDRCTLVAECIGTSNLRSGTVVQIIEDEGGDSNA
jgi:hypothetical protein